MPFQSEKQRRYLWANEPEIARDWTDTYGSRIEAALGGIMALAQGGRIGFKKGDGPAGGASAGGNYGGDSSGGDNQGAGGGKSEAQGGQFGDSYSDTGKAGGEIDRMLNRKVETKPKGLFDNFNARDFLPFGKYSLTGMGIRGLSNVFGGTTPSTGNVGPAGLTNAGTYGTVQDAINAGRRNETPVDRGGNNPYITPYLNDVYAQNVMEEDGLDIDTSTGNMEDWSHNFRVGNPYRQDKQGQLDPQIREMINKLYT